jgi:hypothetical protein
MRISAYIFGYFKAKKTKFVDLTNSKYEKTLSSFHHSFFLQ